MFLGTLSESNTYLKAHPLLSHKSEIVSDESELLILVDNQDQEIGTLDKQSCHDGDGVLHRAFSVFIFNTEGDLLIQKRAAGKRLWPGFWSNSCCSHPRAGEHLADAANRRCEQELGLRAELEFLYKFEYQANFGSAGSEHELCSVFVGSVQGEPRFNATEIEAINWISPASLDHNLEHSPEEYTPWFQMEWQKLNADFRDHLPF